MKNLFKLVLVILLLVSCKDAQKSSDSKESQITEGLLNEVMGNNVDIDKKYALLMEELKTKTLLTDQELLEAYPKKLGNLKLDSNEARITGDKTVVGSFGDNTVRMEILDAGGENVMGAIIPLKMLELNKITSEYNNTIRYSKKERNGILTFGTDRDEDTKADYQSEIRFLYDNRFYVTLEGKNMDSNKLWGVLGVENLQRFKDFN
ncbi:hypothetical protein EV196_101133 [Mariniflexile fucanivorans]|uniref:Uncharacterized protein n=1 Tax=Mariniflexile fucanivorans TaxID=264023 RepID=A0A4R1RQX2_9FLAO|nr:hypothetical protein [Mariniflexile fucanivorans]TCL68714.1 hypothetical protein EV196_101133 [Mariniflexile fucanivorans]